MVAKLRSNERYIQVLSSEVWVFLAAVDNRDI
jgi:hypothetical protein